MNSKDKSKYERGAAGAVGNPKGVDNHHGSSQTPEHGDHASEQPMTFRQIVGSVLAAALGVQSSKNRERDFRQGRPIVFIIAGLLFTGLFIGTVYTVVSLVLSTR